MPRFLLPKRSTPHRVAAIALYRALLSQCSAAPLPDEPRSSLRNAIRQKFRKNKKLSSPYQLGLVFRSGYETLDHLDAAKNGNEKSISFLQNLIDSLPNGVKRPPPIYPPRSAYPPPTPNAAFQCLPPEKAVLNVRPRAQLSGPRHVPILANANGIPFIRLTKPQPPALSRVLRQLISRALLRFDTRILLDIYHLPLARQEDEWDEILRRDHGFIEEEQNGGEVVLWRDAVQSAAEKNLAKYRSEIEQNLENRRKMTDIVLQEQELAKKEGRKIVRGKMWKQSTRRVPPLWK